MRKYLLIVFLLVTATQIQAQNKSNVAITVETVAKKWVFSDLINPNLSKEEYAENKDLLTDTVIEFRKDMTFTFSFVTDLDGNWKLDKNTITTTDRRGKNTWTIYKITEKEITMARNGSEQKIVFKAN